ncbi:hypothetical protein [Lactobacillus helveticus]|nr:hypothetical protein [Lactobacillus helveticus]
MFKNFRQLHPDTELNMLQWKKNVREGLKKFYEDEISPLDEQE